jgi:hypothetical protein
MKKIAFAIIMLAVVARTPALLMDRQAKVILSSLTQQLPCPTFKGASITLLLI